MHFLYWQGDGSGGKHRVYSIEYTLPVSIIIQSCCIAMLMKGTKVLTLGAGREILPHNMAVTKMVDADDIYTRPLAIRMRYMCIYACAVLLIGGRAGRFTDSWSLTSLLRVGHRVATLLDSTRESILALRYNFWRLLGAQSCRGKPVLICILALSLVFTPYLSNAVVSAKSPH